jgi:hypothetical protein
MPDVSTEELLQLLRTVRRATIVTLWAETVPPMRARHPTTRQRNPFHGRLTKCARVNGVIRWNYRRAVIRQRVRERGLRTARQLARVRRFDPAPRAWGQRVDDTPLIAHGTQYYLEVKVQRIFDDHYRLDGVPVRSSDQLAQIAVYLVKRRSEGARQRLRRPVVLRDYRLDHILALQMGGVRYTVASRAR